MSDRDDAPVCSCCGKPATWLCVFQFPAWMQQQSTPGIGIPLCDGMADMYETNWRANGLPFSKRPLREPTRWSMLEIE